VPSGFVETIGERIFAVKAVSGSIKETSEEDSFFPLEELGKLTEVNG
jgi:hypothetical protein